MKKLAQIIISRSLAIKSYLQNRCGFFVLRYHRINDDLSANYLIMPVKKFREQMLYVKKNCDVLSMERVLSIIEGNKWPAQRRPQVVITFDDGYRDNYVNAFSVLKEYQLPATIFLVASMMSTDEKMIRYEDMPAPDMLRWEEVEEMSKFGITFGGHTHTHPHLQQLIYEEQKREIKTGIEAVYNRLKTQITQSIFCYPYGEYNQDTLKIMKELGIKAAFTCIDGLNTNGIDPIEIKRIGMDGTHGLVDFMRRIH